MHNHTLGALHDMISAPYGLKNVVVPLQPSRFHTQAVSSSKFHKHMYTQI